MLAAVHGPHARILAAAAAAGAVCLAASGCASFDAAFGKREAVVHFQPGTRAPEMLRIRAACSHLAAARPEPIPRHVLALDLSDDIRYLVTNASDAQIARLEQCLGRFPSVAGIDLTSPSGD
jgi:hypothetical protein